MCARNAHCSENTRASVRAAYGLTDNVLCHDFCNRRSWWRTDWENDRHRKFQFYSGPGSDVFHIRKLSKCIFLGPRWIQEYHLNPTASRVRVSEGFLRAGFLREGSRRVGFVAAAFLRALFLLEG